MTGVVVGSRVWLGRFRSRSWVRCWVSWLSGVDMGGVWLLLVSASSVGLGGTQDQARPSLEQRAVRGVRCPAGVGGLRWKRER